MGEKTFVTGAAANAATVTVGGFDFTEARLNKSTSGFSDSDTAIPTEKTSKARIDTISAVTDGFSMIQWGKRETSNSENYVPIMPFTSSTASYSSSSWPASNIETYIHWYPFCLNQDMTLKGFEFKVRYDDTGPLWVCIWEDTSYTGTYPYAHAPGDLKAWMKTNPASPPSAYNSAIYVDDGNDGIVYDSDNNNTQVALSAGIYWVSLHAEANHGGHSSYAMTYVWNKNQQKMLYTGGGQGLQVGHHPVSQGDKMLGYRYTSSGHGHKPDTSDGSWTPPSSWTGASSFSHAQISYASYGPPQLAFLMI